MRPVHLALLLVLLPASALCRRTSAQHHQEDYEDDQQQDENKDVSESSGHSLVIDLSSLGVLAALKIKFVVVLLIAFAVFLLISKGYKTQCLFGNCRPNYSTYGYYPYVDYNYVGYEVPAASAAAAAYRRPTPPHLSDLTARVWNSIDLAGMAFSALNIDEDDCRRKLVCQADRAAASNPLLRAALSWFSNSLARYRTDRSRVGAGEGAEWREEDPCEDMYPHCVHRDLPSSLGGPEPVYNGVHEVLSALGSEEEGAPPEQHLQQHQWLRPQHTYRHAYPYEDPQRYPDPESLLPNPQHHDAGFVPIRYQHHHHHHPGGDAADAAASPAASTVLAVVPPTAAEPPAAAATTPSTQLKQPATPPPPPPPVPGRSADSGGGDGPPEPRTPLAPASNATAAPLPPPTVWRRNRFGATGSNRTKLHVD